MTNVKIAILMFFVLKLEALAYEPQEGNVTAMIGPFVTRTDYPGSDRIKAPWFGGVGLIVQGDLHEKGALEIAMFHMQKAYFRQTGPLLLAEKVELMHITMGYRHWLSPLYSASLALSSSYPMNEKSILHNDFPVNQPADTSTSDTVDYGFDISLQAELWNSDRFSVITDVRYGLSVTEKPDEKGSHYGLLIGLKYLIQEKYPSLTKDQKN